MAISRICSRMGCFKSTTNAYYCSRSCAITVNNALQPKRVKAVHTEPVPYRRCKQCDAVSRNRYCDDICKKTWQKANPRRGSVRQTPEQIERGVKTCSICGKEKSVLAFGRAGTSLNPRCKPCMGNVVNKSIQSKPTGLQTVQVRNRRFVKDYGITIVQFWMIFDRQNGKCAVCGTSEEILKSTGIVKKGHTLPDGLHVDHCHETGEVRGLLCGKHNRALGGFDDNIEYLKAAVTYLETVHDITEYGKVW